MERDLLIRRRQLHDETLETDLMNLTPSERIGLMWQVTLDAYAFVPDFDAESRLQRHIVRVLRREG